jgi:hypothetical protein
MILNLVIDIIKVIFQSLNLNHLGEVLALLAILDEVHCKVKFGIGQICFVLSELVDFLELFFQIKGNIQTPKSMLVERVEILHVG